MISCINRLLSYLDDTDQFFESTLLNFDDALPTRHKTSLSNQLKVYLPIANKAHQSFIRQKKDGTPKNWSVRIWVNAIERVLVRHAVDMGVKKSVLTKTLTYIAFSFPEGTPEINAARLVRDLYPQRQNPPD